MPHICIYDRSTFYFNSAQINTLFGHKHRLHLPPLLTSSLLQGLSLTDEQYHLQLTIMNFIHEFSVGISQNKIKRTGQFLSLSDDYRCGIIGVGESLGI